MRTLLLQILFTIITVFGIEILKVGFTYLNDAIDKFQKSKAMIKEVKLNAAIDKVQGIVDLAVTSVADAYVKGLKEEGKFDDVAKQLAKDKAIEIIKTYLPKNVEKTIVPIYGDLETFLADKIKQSVDKTKNIDTMIAATPVEVTTVPDATVVNTDTVA